jgi:arylsulfatase A-like enzyme
MVPTATTRAGLLLLLAAWGCGREPPQHLLLVTADTLRADHLGAWGSGRDLTPRLDALAAESIVFERAWAPTPFTLPSLAALLTGHHPEALQLRDNVAGLPPGVATLAAQLRERGFRTGAVMGNGVVSSKTRMNEGFEVYDTRSMFPEASEAPWLRSGRTTDIALDVADALLVRPGERLFLWVHYLDPHGPYDVPEALRSELLPAERARPDGRLVLPHLASSKGSGGIPLYQGGPPEAEVAFYRAGYAGEVAILDRAIGRLLDGLEQRGVLDAAALVFTADHGESLGEDDAWFLHGEQLSEPNLRVPLLIRLPGQRAAVRADPASLLDVVPTLAALFELPAQGLRGRDLLRSQPAERSLYLATSEAVSTRRRVALARGEWKLVRSFGQPGEADSEKLFRLPDEERDLAGEHPELAQELRDELDARIANP